MFQPAPSNRRAGLTGRWEPIQIFGEPAVDDLDLALSLDGTTLDLSGCALGYGPGYQPEIERRIRVGEETRTVEYDCTAPSDAAANQAAEFHDFLLGGPELTVWPNAVLFSWNGREAVSVRVSQPVDLDGEWMASRAFGEEMLGELRVNFVGAEMELSACAWGTVVYKAVVGDSLVLSNPRATLRTFCAQSAEVQNRARDVDQFLRDEPVVAAISDDTLVLRRGTDETVEFNRVGPESD